MRDSLASIRAACSCVGRGQGGEARFQRRLLLLHFGGDVCAAGRRNLDTFREHALARQLDPCASALNTAAISVDTIRNVYQLCVQKRTGA